MKVKFKKENESLKVKTGFKNYLVALRGLSLNNSAGVKVVPNRRKRPFLTTP